MRVKTKSRPCSRSSDRARKSPSGRRTPISKPPCSVQSASSGLGQRLTHGCDKTIRKATKVQRVQSIQSTPISLRAMPSHPIPFRPAPPHQHHIPSHPTRPVPSRSDTTQPGLTRPGPPHPTPSHPFPSHPIPTHPTEVLDTCPNHAAARRCPNHAVNKPTTLEVWRRATVQKKRLLVGKKGLLRGMNASEENELQRLEGRVDDAGDKKLRHKRVRASGPQGPKYTQERARPLHVCLNGVLCSRGMSPGCSQLSIECVSCSHTSARADARTQTTHTHTHTHTQAHAHTHTHTSARTHTHTRVHAFNRRT